MPSPESGSTSPAASPRSATPPLREPRPWVDERKPVAADVLQARLRNAALAAEAQPGARRSRGPSRSQPPTPTFDVVALREDPAVPAGNVGELEAEQPAILGFGDDAVRDVRLERHAVVAAVVEPDRARGDAVRPVGEQRVRCGDPRAVDLRLDAVAPRARDQLTLTPSPELRPPRARPARRDRRRAACAGSSGRAARPCAARSDAVKSSPSRTRVVRSSTTGSTENGS